MFLTSRKFEAPTFRTLLPNERIKAGDVIESLGSGRLTVGNGYYGFLRGQRADQARELPDVFDVVRRYGQ